MGQADGDHARFEAKTGRVLGDSGGYTWLDSIAGPLGVIPLGGAMAILWASEEMGPEMQLATTNC